MSKTTLINFASNPLKNRAFEVERGEMWLALDRKFKSLFRHLTLSSRLFTFIYYTFFGVVVENLKRWRFDTFVTRVPAESYRAITLPTRLSLGKPLYLSYVDLASLLEQASQLTDRIAPTFKPLYLFLSPYYIPRGGGYPYQFGILAGEGYDPLFDPSPCHIGI